MLAASERARVLRIITIVSAANGKQIPNPTLTHTHTHQEERQIPYKQAPSFLEASSCREEEGPSLHEQKIGEKALENLEAKRNVERQGSL